LLLLADISWFCQLGWNHAVLLLYQEGVEAFQSALDRAAALHLRQQKKRRIEAEL
jgi:hypothetical protein